MTQPPRWSDEQLRSGYLQSPCPFGEERLQEPLEAYTLAFDQYHGAIGDLLRATSDLSQLSRSATEIITNPALLGAFRYLAGPPISEGIDLRVLAEASLSPARLRADPEMAARVLEVVKTALDRRRFPWVTEERQPSESERLRLSSPRPHCWRRAVSEP